MTAALALVANLTPALVALDARADELKARALSAATEETAMGDRNLCPAYWPIGSEFGGAWYADVDAADAGIRAALRNTARLADLSWVAVRLVSWYHAAPDCGANALTLPCEAREECGFDWYCRTGV